MIIRMMGLVVLSCVVVASGIVLLPKSEERAVIAKRDGKIEEAISILEHLIEGGDRDRALRMQLHMLHEEAGQAESAIEILEAYQVEFGNDAWALDKLANLYRTTMQPNKRVRALEKLLALDPKPNRAQELLGLYRLAGDEMGEFQMLTNASVDPMLTFEDFERRAVLWLARGDDLAALSSFATADQLAPKAAFEGRFAYLDLLLQHRQFELAMASIQRWAVGWADEEETIIAAMTMFSKRAHSSQVVALARRLAEKRPDFDLWLAQGLSVRHYPNLARAIYAARAASLDRIDAKSLDVLVAAAAASHDVTTPLKLLRQMLADPDKTTEAAYVGEAIMRHIGTNILIDERRLFDISVLAQRPLFGVELALEVQNPLLANQIMQNGQLSNVPAHGARRYAELLFLLLGPKGAMQKYNDARRMDKLHPAVAAAVTDNARQYGALLGHAALDQAQSQTARARQPPNIPR